jgi:hypothetical protein
MLTRWAAPPTLVQIRTEMLPPVSPSSDEPFVWPTAQEIRRVQDAALIDASPLPDMPVLAEDDMYRTSGGQVWIPDASIDLQIRICIVAHTGPGGNRELRAATSSINSLSFWNSLKEDVQTFFNTCLHFEARSVGTAPPSFWRGTSCILA